MIRRPTGLVNAIPICCPVANKPVSRPARRAAPQGPKGLDAGAAGPTSQSWRQSAAKLPT